MKLLKTWAATAALLVLSGPVRAELFDRGGGMIYDSTRNITWLADMNYARTSGHAGTGVSDSGAMSWAAATDWAGNLVYGGYSDWRQPTLNPVDITCSASFNPGGGFPSQHFGYNCAGGELSGLFATELGTKAGESVLYQVGDTAEQIANLALFSNVQPAHYWSGTEYAPDPRIAWHYHAGVGNQSPSNGLKYNQLYAAAVRPGDVAPVPEPQALAMLLVGLGVLAVVVRRQPL